MRSPNRLTTAPVKVPRTNRNHPVQVLTSAPAGVCAPIAFIPMFREDSANGRLRIAVEMAETKEILMNPTHCRITAYVVPDLARERFGGSRDEFDKSYMGELGAGGAVIPFVETAPFPTHGSNAVYRVAGIHGKPGDEVSTSYLEAYNIVWNFRAKQRSMDIEQRERLDATLAPAFWNSSRFAHVVPDFDQAVIDGEVALNIVDQRIPVRGLGILNHGGSPYPGMTAYEYGDTSPKTYDQGFIVTDGDPPMAGHTRMGIRVDENLLPAMFAELQEGGVTVSLSNIEMAKKTQAFAKIRQAYEGFDDEYIIDMLMSGLTIPDQHLKQPILLADKTVPFAQAKRYATDAGNLAESAVSGAARTELSIRVPKLNTGGVIVIIAEFVPEQLFERMRDPYLYSTAVSDYPEYLRDVLDPEKVDVVKNGEVDTSHDNPELTFGYAPMGWKWTVSGPKIGGKFYRPSANTATDEERQRLWAVEDLNPKLSSSFYIVDEIHQKPFLDTAADPFELTAGGNVVINGNTVFGGLLVEATGNYEKVLEKAPVQRIEGTPE